MNLLFYVHVNRTLVGEITGIGKHIVRVVGELVAGGQVHGELLVAEEWARSDGKLVPESALPAGLPLAVHPGRQIPTERRWKLTGFPRLDRYVGDHVDCVYAPMETFLPIRKRPVAVTIHDIHPFEPAVPWAGSRAQRLARWKWGRWIHRAIQESRLVLTVSEFSKSRMVELLGAPAEKIVVVGNGVDEAYFEMARTDPATLPRPLEGPYVIVVGGLKYKKGADYVLDVAGALRRRRSELTICVAGTNDALYEGRLAGLDNVRTLGYVPEPDLPGLVRGASSLLFLSHYEGFGIPALEAMAAGVPAVVAERGALPEVVGDAGLVVAPEDAEAVTDLLESLASDARVRQERVTRGQARARAFTWQACAERVLDALRAAA